MTGPPDHGTTTHPQAHRDLMLAGLGILALGILGVVTVSFVIVGSRASSAAEVGVLFVGGAFLLVFAGSMIAGIGVVRRTVPAVGGCGSLALGVGLGGALFLASIGFLFVTCVAMVSTH
jgi:hypothetical protein